MVDGVHKEAVHRAIRAHEVCITLAEYEELLAAQEKLNMLEAFGVDQWDGYAAAMEAMEDEDGY